MSVFSLNLFESIVVFLTLSFGSTVQSIVGFGAGPVSVPILLLIDPVMVPGPVLLNMLILSILISIRNRAGIDFAGLGMAIIGRVPGAILGVFVLVVLSAKPLSIFLGSLVLLAVLISLTGARLRPTKINLLSAGALSGFMATSTSIGGPPMALIYQHSSATRLRGTLAGFFILGTIISMVALHFGNRFGTQELTASLYLLPGTITGFIISGWVAKVVAERWLQPAVLLFSSLTAIGVIIKSILV